MSAPLYFLPGVRLTELVQDGRLSQAILTRFELADVLADVAVGDLSKLDITAKGPNGSSGVMFCTNTAGQPPHRVGYFPDFQRWQNVLAQPELWIGVDKEHPPTPADLARKRLLDGHPVKLADGNTYTIPYVRSPVHRTALPEDMYRGPDKQFVVELQPAYQEIWDATAAAWDLIYPDTADGKEPEGMFFEDILDLCIRFIRLNYRYGQSEQAVLRLVDKTRATWEETFAAAVDIPFVTQKVLELQKKSESQEQPVTPSTSPG